MTSNPGFATLTVNVQKEFVNQVESLVRNAMYPSRSEAIRIYARSLIQQIDFKKETKKGNKKGWQPEVPPWLQNAHESKNRIITINISKISLYLIDRVVSASIFESRSSFFRAAIMIGLESDRKFIEQPFLTQKKVIAQKKVYKTVKIGGKDIIIYEKKKESIQ